jgi:uncharacterized membrane protein
MANESTYLLIIAAAVAILLIYAYIRSIWKILERVGFSVSEVSVIVLITLFFGSVTIPLFPYHGWWVGISIGGALIPLILCAYLAWTKRVNLAELLIGVVIVTYISYLVTRPEEDVGIVADLPLAFMPALAAGLFALSTFWVDISRAAPLAYSSGIIGTIIGADLLHLSEMLSFTAPSDQTVVLSIGGANIFDMVYLTGIIAVAVDIVVFWIKKQERRQGLGLAAEEIRRQAEDLPYAKDVQPSPRLEPGRRGRI